LRVSPELGVHEYVFSTSSGDLVWKDGKRMKGACLMAMYPNVGAEQLPSLNWPPKS